MEVTQIFALQFVLSIVVFSLIAKWVLVPRFAEMKPREVLFWLILPHAFRHIGMVFLVPGIVAETLPANFAYPAAFGDLLACILALFAMNALRGGCTNKALALVWIFNTIGALDLLFALSHVAVVPLFGAAWYIPTFLVPVLLVSHFMIFKRLLSPAYNAQFKSDTATCPAY